ncbi:MAG TPA: adenosylcobinamide-phosphate synthase CbiB [bacterium]|nr:adenosylcobinamide-phosphate synthase CbiB [bacterium]HPN31624.1 adenosylcobinamide-phosphate synthase CbiB [bacterium]
MSAYIFLTAYILDLIIGDPHQMPHLVRFIGRTINFYYSILKKYNYFVSGFILFFLVIISVSGMYYLLKNFLPSNLKIIFDVVINFYCLSTRSLYDESMKVYYAIKKKDIADAKKKLSFIVGRDTANLPEPEIIRGAVETVAENISDGIIAPIFYIALFGAAGGIIYKTVNTLDSMVGYKNEKFRKIGYCSAKADDILNFIPARLTACIIILIAIFYRNFKFTYRSVKKYHSCHSSPNSGWGESAAAGILKIQIGGENYYFGELVKKPLIGEPIIPLNIEHIREINKIMFLVSLAGFLTAFIIILKFGHLISTFAAGFFLSEAFFLSDFYFTRRFCLEK